MEITGKPHLHLDEYTNEIAQVGSTCPMCGTRRTLEVGLDALHNWVVGGFLIQRAFPHLSASDREALMTGICDTCWGEDE